MILTEISNTESDEISFFAAKNNKTIGYNKDKLSNCNYYINYDNYNSRSRDNYMFYNKSTLQISLFVFYDDCECSFNGKRIILSRLKVGNI